MINKVFWITGGGSGIGSQLAVKLAKLGNIVIISGRTKSKLEKTSKNDKRIIPIIINS